MFTLFWSQNFQNHRHSFTLNLTQLAGYIRLRDKPFLYFLTDSELYYIRDLWPWFSPLGKLADWALFRNFLARSAKLPTGLYILLALISVFFFFLFFIFLMIFRRQIITGSAGPIFVIFSLNESVLGADDRSGPFFRYLKGSCHGNQLCEKRQTPHFLHSGIQKWYGITPCIYAWFISTTSATTSCKILLKIGPVVSATSEGGQFWRCQNAPKLKLIILPTDPWMGVVTVTWRFFKFSEISDNIS